MPASEDGIFQPARFQQGKATMTEEQSADAAERAASPLRGHDAGLPAHRAEFRVLDDPVRGVAGSLDEMVHGVGGIFDGLDDQDRAAP